LRPRLATGLPLHLGPDFLGPSIGALSGRLESGARELDSAAAYHRRVHLRRALLLFALILGLTALATAVAPPPPPPDDSTVTPEPPRPAVQPPTTVTLQAPAPRPALRAHRVKPGDHVIVQVNASEGGEVSLPKLGRTATVADGAPASFDVIVPAAGRYDVLFEPALGTPARVGTLVSR
jgi:hypothetical protein